MLSYLKVIIFFLIKLILDHYLQKIIMLIYIFLNLWKITMLNIIFQYL